MLRRTFIWVGVAALLGACTPNQQVPSNEPVTNLRVENQAYLDMTIYVFRGSERLRLGIANGNSTTVLHIPASLLFGATVLQFQAVPIASSRAPLSEEITVNPGDEVRLTIPPN